MSSAKFNYSNDVLTSGSLNDRFSDTFFGTSKVDNANALSLLNYQMQYNEYMQDKANAFNVMMQDKANAFNKEMSSTAYQRAMKDMQAAGINPLVGFAGGASPSFSPQSATAHSAITQSPSASAPKYDRQGGIIGRATAKMVNEFADNLSGKNLREMLPQLVKAVF